MSVEVSDEGAATIVTLRWPDKRNALNPRDASETEAAIREASRRARAVVVLAAEGAFCSGGDLRAFAKISAECSEEEIAREVYGKMQGMIRALSDCPVPTIAAVDGPAIGLGCDLALACDMRFVGKNGWLQQGWGRANLIAATGGVGFLSRLAPGSFWSLLATQERLGPRECEKLGIGLDAGEESAKNAAMARADELSKIEREVLEAYVALERPTRWPPADHFSQAATYQGRFIGSSRFREQAKRLLDGL